MGLLQNIINVLPEAYRLAINSLVNRKKKAGEIITTRQQVMTARSLANRLSTSGPVFTPIPAKSGDIISSKDHNTNFENIFIDLFALYRQLDMLDKVMLKRQTIADSDYLKSRAAIEKLINDSRTYALRRKFKEFNEISIIDFNIAKNISKASPRAIINPKTRLLELPAIYSSRAHIEHRDGRTTSLYTRTIGPGTKSSSSILPLTNIIDQRPATFWVKEILADAPITVEYEGKNYNGPILELYVKFSTIEQINVVRLLPFAEFPLKLIDIQYRTSVSTTTFRSVEFQEEEATLDWIQASFKPIFAAELKLVLLQENYKDLIFVLPRDLALNTDLFEQIANQNIKKLSATAIQDSDFVQELLELGDLYSKALKDLEDIIGFVDLSDGEFKSLDNFNDSRSIIGVVLGQVAGDEAKQFITTDVLEDSEGDSNIFKFRKVEYLIGIRELETTYEIYSPVGYFKSEPYMPQATVSDLQIEVDLFNHEQSTSWGDINLTSVEFDVDFGEGRIVPIHPANLVDEAENPIVESEILQIDPATLKGRTRLTPRFDNPLAVYKDGVLLPPSAYTYARDASNRPTLEITLKKEYWSPSSIYTIDYDVADSSVTLDIFDLFSPRELPQPDTFKKVGPDKDVSLSRYPFVNYAAINNDLFEKTPDEAEWKYIPPINNILTGQLKVWPTITTDTDEVITSGSLSGYMVSGEWGKRKGQAPFDLNSLDVKYFVEPFGYYIKIQDLEDNNQVDKFLSSSGLLFKEAPSIRISELRQLPSGATAHISGLNTSTPTGYIVADYVLGVGITLEDELFVFDNSVYTPIEVTVGGKKAKNITDYETLQHPAFSLSNIQDKEYQYIQAGNRLYFNQEPQGEIKVEYKWLTEKVAINATLRSHKAINPDLSPVVDEIRVLINTSVI